MVEEGETGVAMSEIEDTDTGAEPPTDRPQQSSPQDREDGGAESEPVSGEGTAGESAEETLAGNQTEEEPGEEEQERLLRSVAALVFASPEPLGIGRIVGLLEDVRPARVRHALEELGRRLEACGLPLELRQIAGGWRLVTAPDSDEVVARLEKARKIERLSPAGLETLAVVAYRQPVTKAEVEAIRGVQCGPMLRGLVDRGLARVVGRSEQPGHALEYGTTRAFLDRFGLADLKELPRDGELLG